MRLIKKVYYLAILVAAVTFAATSLFAEEQPQTASTESTDSKNTLTQDQNLSLKKILDEAETNLKRVNAKLAEKEKMQAEIAREDVVKKHYDRGNSLYSQGNIEEAKKEWDAAIRSTKDKKMKSYIRTAQTNAEREIKAKQKTEAARQKKTAQDNAVKEIFAAKSKTDSAPLSPEKQAALEKKKQERQRILEAREQKRQAALDKKQQEQQRTREAKEQKRKLAEQKHKETVPSKQRSAQSLEKERNQQLELQQKQRALDERKKKRDLAQAERQAEQQIALEKKEQKRKATEQKRLAELARKQELKRQQDELRRAKENDAQRKVAQQQHERQRAMLMQQQLESLEKQK